MWPECEKIKKKFALINLIGYCLAAALVFPMTNEESLMAWCLLGEIVVGFWIPICLYTLIAGFNVAVENLKLYL